ncbi:hypothetical protein AR457_33845 [Streptomyces agglomeratus]|uniref:hypothetical protein n=1 Tax=Streptomyces agglomeratus TaxID=285458 RepID=UPI0008528522|nr:hypothetical protein [Streptomyces agglomeratus]OEJ22186.1 hypothetical protein AR457_40690 [Streptomyces agglomeratus]OEJ37026.1 hypothetical protein BGK70_01340 [Streptomyces agglomeratus]OEJ48380.1 hypothetical protein AR457_33845 [Streptomyces agglomeratus]
MRFRAHHVGAFKVAFDTTSEQVDADTGRSPAEVATLVAMWEQIEAVIPREELAAAISAVRADSAA